MIAAVPAIRRIVCVPKRMRDGQHSAVPYTMALPCPFVPDGHILEVRIAFFGLEVCLHWAALFAAPTAALYFALSHC